MTALPARRRFLGAFAGRVGAAAIALPAAATLITRPARAALPGPRRLAFAHTHTGERLDIVFADGEQHRPGALAALDRFLRDHYTGEVGRIDPQLFDLLHRTQAECGGSGVYEVISGYRCPATNDRLRETRGGGVARRSLHMDGRAIDVRLTGVALADLRDAAAALRAGGVGHYPRERFVHLDTGRVRAW